MLCSQLVGVEWIDSAGQEQNCVVNLEDISESGACLHSEEPIPVKSRVTIAHRKDRLSGAVRYCVDRSVGYLLGVEFDSSTRWSDSRLRPNHLTNVRDLVKQSIHRDRS